MEVSSTNPLFTFLILVRKSRHFLLPTLDALKAQTAVGFEVILMDAEGSGRLYQLAHRYPHLPLRIYPACDLKSGAMMNEGVRLARGKYIQFLEPGDRYLSQYGLEYLKELIQESGNPHLVYFGFLMRSPNHPPVAVNFSLSLEQLKKGNVSHSSWFLKDKILEVGGFDAQLSQRPIFDFLCRLFEKEGVRAVYSRRVLTDFERQRAVPADMFRYITETWKILYRHFGLSYALKWIFIQDHFQIMRRTAQLFKRAFWKSN